MAMDLKNKKIKVLNFVSGGDNGGVKHCFLHYQKVLQSLVSETVPCVRSNFPCFEELLQINPNVEVVRYFRTDFPWLRSLSIKWLRQMLMRVQPHAIITHKNIDFKLLKLASEGLSIKIIGVLHGYNASYASYPDALIAVSNGVKAHVAESVPSQKIYVVHNPVDFSTIPTRPFELQHPPVLGTMALFKRRKRINDLLRAAYWLKKDGVPFKMKIAGRSWRLILSYHYQRWQEKTQDCVEFLPWVKDKVAFLDSLDIFCLNSRAEAFGMVLTEAMARKKIVVATDCEGPKEIITHGVNGFLVPKCDPKAFAHQLKNILEGEYDLVQVAEKAYERAQELGFEPFKAKLQGVLTAVLHEDE